MMHDRSNGLGGGFAAYGIYPDFENEWAFHIIYDDESSKKNTEEILNVYFRMIYEEEIPVRKTPQISNIPIIYRYFLKYREGISADGFLDTNPAKDRLGHDGSEENFIADFVMKVNSDIEGAYIISSGKNMGIFKGVGYPEDIGNFFRLDEYKGYLWTSHGRFPTNSVGWWGGAKGTVASGVCAGHSTHAIQRHDVRKVVRAASAAMPDRSRQYGPDSNGRRRRRWQRSGSCGR